MHDHHAFFRLIEHRKASVKRSTNDSRRRSTACVFLTPTPLVPLSVIRGKHGSMEAWIGGGMQRMYKVQVAETHGKAREKKLKNPHLLTHKHVRPPLGRPSA